MPVLPLTYSLAQPLIQRWGFVAGRFFTAILALASALVAGALASELLPSWQRIEAGLLTLILVLINVYQAYFFAVVKTYSLTAFFLLSGIYILAIALKRRSTLAALFSGAILVLAGGTRISAGIALPIIFVYLVLQRHKFASLLWLYFGLGSLLMACIVILPFAFIAPESFWFCIFKYHTVREAGTFYKMLVYKAGFLSRLLHAYFVPVALWFGIGLAKMFFSAKPDQPDAQDFSTPEVTFIRRALWACLIGITLIHLSASFPYDDYQVFAYPLFAIVVSVMAVRFVARARSFWLHWLLLVVFILSIGASVSSPINQNWVVKGRDRIWWKIKEKSPLKKLQEAGVLLKTMTRRGDLLLTQDPYLAVESGLFLPRGLEMGQFSYFPELSLEKAKKFHVLNRVLMERLLETCNAPVAALSGYAFAIQSPEIKLVSIDEQYLFRHIVLQHFRPVCEITDFGQAFTTLQILKRKQSTL